MIQCRIGLSLCCDFNVQIMSRRGSPQVLAFVAVGVVFVYGFYSYNELKSALRRSDDSIKRSKLESDNLSTQLLGIAGLVATSNNDSRLCSYVGLYKMQSAKMRIRATYIVRNKMRSRFRILYVIMYKLRNEQTEKCDYSMTVIYTHTNSFW